MLNFIKTAIITIIISFASGLLLEYYKNLAPRILCSVGNAIFIQMNNKKIYAYIITVTNESNKTIHELTLNIQSSQTNLKSTDAKITKGLKFNSSIKNNILDVYIPFLSKGDKFSVTVYVEKQYTVNNKPVIVIRSPENFKEIDSVEQNGILSLLFIVPKNIHQLILDIMKKSKAIVPNKKDDSTAVLNKVSGTEQTINKETREVFHKNKKPSSNRNQIIIIVSIILLMITGVLGKLYLSVASTNTQTPIVNTSDSNKSTDATGSAGGTTKVTNATKETTGGLNELSGGKTGNSSSTGSSGYSTGNSGSAKSSSGITRNSSSTGSSGYSTGNSSSTRSSGYLTRNSSSTGSSEYTTGNSSSTKSSGGTTGNSSSTKSSGGITTNSSSTGSSGSTTKDSGSTGSSGSITGNSSK